MRTAKEKGRASALKIVEQLRPQPVATQEPATIDLSPVVEALAALANDPVDLSPVLEAIAAAEREPLNLSPLIEAIARLKLDARVDLEPVALQIAAIAEKPATDLKPVISKLDDIKSATEANTKAVLELVAVAKMSKAVEYDAMGRIIKIGVSE